MVDKPMQIQLFRNTVYQSIQKRADAFFDLLDAMTVAGHVSSPVALSEEAPFRRKFSSVFDTLQNIELDFDQLLPALYEHQPQNSELIEGYEVYALDTTPNERPEAETLEERVSLKSEKNEPVRYGHKYSWLARLVNWGKHHRQPGRSSAGARTGSAPSQTQGDCGRQSVRCQCR